MSNYCKIYFADNSHPLTVAKVLHWFEEHLPAGVFWRTHKIHLVNSRYVKQLHTAPKRYLLLLNSEILVVSGAGQLCIKKVMPVFTFLTS